MALSTKEEFIAQCMAGTEKTREECEAEWNVIQTSVDQGSKEEYMAECVKGERTEEECLAAWNEAHKAGDFASVIRENKMLKVKLDRSNKLLKEATQIIKAVNVEKDAVTDAKKYELAIEIERDTDGKDNYKDLMKESIDTLRIMKTAIDKAKPKDFVSVAALAEGRDRKEPQLTVGEFDPISKKWKGGN